MLSNPDTNTLMRFWVPIKHLGFRTQELVKGKYIGQHNGIHLMTHFNKELCMHVVSELTTGYGIANAFKEEFAIRKAKRRIDVNKESMDLFIKATNAEYGALNGVISTK
ncbi:hypothetical protein COE56_25860 [Bacillus anthracis]|nr:hypothetical protein COE56_25860 [Bacillus anthracis]